MNKYRLSLYFFLLSFCAFGMIGNDYKVLTMRDGLPDNTISYIHKDADGFIWFGTENGLCRYNGVSVSSFSNPEKYIPINHIEESSNGLLWVVSDNYLNLFDRKRESYINIVWNDSEPIMYNLKVIDDSTAWFIESEGIAKMRLKQTYNNGSITGCEAHRLKSFSKDGVCDGRFGRMELLNDSTAIIVTTSHELLFFDLNKGRLLKKVKSDREISTGVMDIKFINNSIWIATIADGLFIYSTINESLSHYSYNPEDSLNSISHTDIYSITPIFNQGAILSTWNGYTFMMPKEDNPLEYDITVYNHNDSSNYKEIETRMLCSYYDTDGILWIGTYGGGVIQADLKQSFYKQYHQDRHNEICQIEIDNEGYLWLATFHKGIMRSSHMFNSKENLNFIDIDLSSIAQNRAIQTFRGILKAKDGSFWFGGNEGTLVHYYPKHPTESILYEGLPKNCDIWCLFLDAQNRFWVGTSSGLYLLNVEKKKFIHYLKGILVRTIVQDSNQSIWVGTNSGLRKLTIAPLSNNESAGYETKFNIEKPSIRSMLLSSNGLLYVGYECGLAIINPITDTLISFYNTRNGLSSNFVGCLAEDNTGQIWVGSNSDISSFNEKQRLFYHYYISGNNRSALASDKYLLFGNNKMLTYFDLDLLDKEVSSIPKKTYITELDVNHEKVSIGQSINGQVILNQSIAYTDKITLNRRNYRFSVAFSDLSYNHGAVRFSYRLTPLENKWNMAEEGQKISFAHLQKGLYVLQVRALSPNGNVGNTTTLDVEILPHWSESIWAYICYIVIICLTIYTIIYRYRKYVARKAYEEGLNREILKINQEREQEKIIHQERVNFFTSVSHELRTPLTLILAPLQEILKKGDIPPAIEPKLELINRNAASLSETVNQLLFLQKAESGMATLHRLDVNIIPLVRDIVSAFSDLIRIKGIELTTIYEKEEITVNLDIKSMESAIRNILSNAVKYTMEHGKIEVSVIEKEIMECSHCQIIVKDNGPGIKKEYCERIFDSFITASNEPTHSTQLGIGLKIVKNTMDLHHGKIDLETDEGKGCCFTLSIPLGNAHYTEEKSHNTPPQDTSSPIDKRKKLLIIEDNLDVQQYLKSLFETKYNIIQSYNGEEGLKAALEELPNLVMCDVMMPVKDGFSCCRDIKANPITSHIPIIMLTARSEEADIIKGTLIGIEDYIMKPFNPEVLEIKVDNLIRQREQMKRIYSKALLIQENPQAQEQESQFMRKLVNVIEMNLSNSNFSVQDIADAFFMSQPTLYRRVKSESQLSVIQIIRKVRISKAAALLLEKRYSVQEVAERVGYNDLKSFRKHFIEQFGVRPSKFAR